MFGGMKTSRKILLPSVRNSLANNMSLIEATHCGIVLCAAPLQDMANNLKKETGVSVLVIPNWEEMVGEIRNEPYPYTKKWSEARKDPTLILHTSGSTGTWSVDSKVCSFHDGQAGLQK